MRVHMVNNNRKANVVLYNLICQIDHYHTSKTLEYDPLHTPEFYSAPRAGKERHEVAYGDHQRLFRRLLSRHTGDIPTHS